MWNFEESFDAFDHSFNFVNTVMRLDRCSRMHPITENSESDVSGGRISRAIGLFSVSDGVLQGGRVNGIHYDPHLPNRAPRRLDAGCWMHGCLWVASVKVRLSSSVLVK